MITKFKFVNEANALALSTDLLKMANTRIRERIATAITDGTSGTINSRTDDNHTLSAKVILGLTDALDTKIGASSDATTASTVYGYINAQKKDTDDKIGATTDATSAATVYGYINNKKADTDAKIGTSGDTAGASTVYGYIKEQDAAINTKIGASTDATTDNTVYGYINAQKKDTDDKIGETTDTGTDATVYGYVNGEIARVEGIIGGLTHLTYQVVTGPISGVTNPKTDIIYLQHDEPSIIIANDGYVMHDVNTRASYTAGGDTYYAYYDAAQDKFFKATNNGGTWTITDVELVSSGASIDPIFTDTTTGAGYEDDNTYNLYIYRQIPETTPAQYEWLCVGNTEIELDNYWSKKESDVVALRALMMEAMTTSEVTSAVTAAWEATDPYTGSSPYWGS